MPKPIATNDIAIRSTTDPEADVLGNVSMFVKKDGAHVPLTEQSDGVRQLTSMTLFDLAEGAANIVAIDEPELHLHPRARGPSPSSSPAPRTRRSSLLTRRTSSSGSSRHTS